MLRVARFLHGFFRHPTGRVVEREVTLEAAGGALPASYLRPLGGRAQRAWIVLHGVTVPGRHHPVLTRFAHALASTGAAVLLPEIPAWRELRLDPRAGDEAVEAAVAHLHSRKDLSPGALNLVGFSFGATQALMAASREGIREHVRGVVAFGGYCDLGRTLHCMMTGEHEWNGVSHRIEPDAYGRWIIIGNYLGEVPEFAHMDELQRGAYELAVESGRLGVYAAERECDPLKAEIRNRLAAEEREIWDIIAPPFGVQPPLELARKLAAILVEAAYRRHPELDPRPLLPRLDQRIVLAHGYDDRLIPFTETLRLQSHLSPAANSSLTLTRLFAHSREAGRLGYLAYPREVTRYFALLQRALEPS